MCYRIRCFRCQKATYMGCGKHVELVLEGIPEEDRCKCPKEEEDDEES